MNYILDTCFLIGIIKGDQNSKQKVLDLNLLSPTTYSYISIASKAELLSFAKYNEWGSKKIDAVNSLLSDLTIVDISDNQKLIERYIDIDTFSKKYKKGAIRMGKNDLWIAATGSMLNCTLITMDNDFDHLIGSGFFPDIIKVSVNTKMGTSQ